MNKKVVKVSNVKQNIKNTIEEITYGSSMFIALLALEYGVFDIALDGRLDNIDTYPKTYAGIFLSPIVIGSLIKKFDPDSETSQDISNMINSFKPKTRKR